jgi:DNA-binding NtrC family response regulator
MAPSVTLPPSDPPDSLDPDLSAPASDSGNGPSPGPPGRTKFPDLVPPTKIVYVDGKPATLRLRVCRLSVHANGKVRDHEFEGGLIRIGAMADNDLVLSDDTVSRYHCKIVQENHSYVLVDLGSTNGTFINRVRIREGYLRPDVPIHIGRTELRFHAGDERVDIVPSKKERLGELIGRHARMRELYAIVEKIAPTATTVVIEGETGTGKEVVAHTLHKLSPRARQPFVVFDCSAVPANLVESELFGHEKGSFTGALMARQGLFELAHGGTLFLDELGELSLDLQPKLLRALEQREIRRVGSGHSFKVDVRVLAATNRNLEEEVRAGRFRQDLFYRLSVVRLVLPPLRERGDDVALLAHHFLRTLPANQGEGDRQRVRELSAEALARLTAYRWPGNVRELHNAIERAVSFAAGDVLLPEDLPEPLSGRPSLAHPDPGPVTDRSSTARVAPTAPDLLDQTSPELSALPNSFKEAKESWVASFEREYVVKMLQRHGGNISHAARDADIDRKYFRKLMRKYAISTGGASTGGEDAGAASIDPDGGGDDDEADDA